MSKLEQLEKNVVGTKAAFDVAAYARADAAWGAADAWDAAEEAAWVALVKARLELNRYLKEQDDD